MKKDIIPMSQKERQRYYLLKMVLDCKTTLKEASRLMGISYRHARRLKKKLATEGARGLIHGNRGRPSTWEAQAEPAPSPFLKGDNAMDERPFSDISYEQYLKEEKLMGSRCTKCGALLAPPRSICIKCYSSEMEWVEMKGEGRLHAFTCITVAPPFMIEQGYNRKHPYCSGVVDLEEGVKVDARIEGVDASKLEEIAVGMPLKVTFLHWGEGENQETFLAFQPL